MKNHPLTLAIFRRILADQSLLQACEQVCSKNGFAAVAQIPLFACLSNLEPSVLSELDSQLLWSLITKQFQELTLQQVDLSGLPLSSADFTNATLEGVNLSHADLAGATFSGAVLEQVDCSQCRASASTWKQVSLKHVSFLRSHLDYALFEILSSSDVDFSMASLYSAHLEECHLPKAQFVGARLPHASLAGAYLPEATFEDADLFSVCATEIQAASATFRNACCVNADFRSATLHTADLTGVRASNVSFQYAILSHANLARADLSQANLRHCDAEHTDFQNGFLASANLSCASLDFANLAGVILYGTKLQGTSTRGAHFGSILQCDEWTQIPVNSHDWISMVLLTSATSFQERQFAAGVRVQQEWCWAQFAEQLAHSSPDLLAWASRVLSQVRSLKEQVRIYTRPQPSASQEATFDEGNNDTLGDLDDHPF